MRIIWLVPILTSSCWLFIVPTYTPADHSFKSPYIYFLFISIAIFAISLSDSIQRPLPGKLYYFAIPLVIVLFFVRFPYNLGAIVILTGLLLNLIPGGYKLFSRTSAGALITGLIILIQGATIPFLYVILSRYHEIKLLNKIVWPFLRIFGLNASTSDSIIYIPFYGGISSFPGTLEKTGFFLFLLIFLSGNIIIFLSAPTWRKLVKFSLLCIFYGIF